MLILGNVNCPAELKERFYVRNIYVEIGPVIESYERQVEAFVVLTCNTSVLKPLLFGCHIYLTQWMNTECWSTENGNIFMSCIVRQVL